MPAASAALLVLAHRSQDPWRGKAKKTSGGGKAKKTPGEEKLKNPWRRKAKDPGKEKLNNLTKLDWAKLWNIALLTHGREGCQRFKLEYDWKKLKLHIFDQPTCKPQTLEMFNKIVTHYLTWELKKKKNTYASSLILSTVAAYSICLSTKEITNI